mmetsp:Transcript_3013/g.11565  ORF Transcript_3013/g.11565 Transcript_3013/m.11565 type:complete len:492 (-) Transcript_3013:69-1544(-)
MNENGKRIHWNRGMRSGDNENGLLLGASSSRKRIRSTGQSATFTHRNNRLNAIHTKNIVNPFDTRQEVLYPSELDGLLTDDESRKEIGPMNGSHGRDSSANHAPQGQAGGVVAEPGNELLQEELDADRDLPEVLSFWENLKQRRDAQEDVAMSQRIRPQSQSHSSTRKASKRDAIGTQRPQTQQISGRRRGGRARRRSPTGAASINQQTPNGTCSKSLPTEPDRPGSSLSLKSFRTPQEKKATASPFLTSTSIPHQPRNKSSIAIQKKYIHLTSIRKHQPMRSMSLSVNPNMDSSETLNSAAHDAANSAGVNASTSTSTITKNRSISTFELTGKSWIRMPRLRKSKFSKVENPGEKHKSLFAHLMAQQNMEKIYTESMLRINAPSDNYSYEAPHQALTTSPPNIATYVPPTITKAVRSAAESQTNLSQQEVAPYNRDRVHNSLAFTKMYTPKKPKRKSRPKKRGTKRAGTILVDKISLLGSPALSAWHGEK